MPLSVVYGCVVYLSASGGAVVPPRPPRGVSRRWVGYELLVFRSAEWTHRGPIHGVSTALPEWERRT